MTEQRKLPILYRDRHILVCQKPAGMPSQPDPSGQEDLLSILNRDDPSVRLIHRLDTPTGGCMVFGRTPMASAALGALVQDHERFSKEYIAVVSSAPIQPEGEMLDQLYHDKRQNKAFVVKGDRRDAKAAKLYYKTLSVHADGRALLLIRLYTGRTHQIRVQCASRGMPLAGDGKYGSRDKCPYIGLWSYRLTFRHPITQEMLSVSSLPDDRCAPWTLFSEALHALQEN